MEDENRGGGFWAVWYHLEPVVWGVLVGLAIVGAIWYCTS